MAGSPKLDRTQRWMQAVIVHPGSDADAVASPEASAEVPAEEVSRMVLPSRTLTSVERVGIYRGMYLARLEEALEADFPGLHHFLGQERFSELVADYVHQNPSRSYTLNRLGDRLPDYIRDRARLPRRAFVHDLARLELAMSQVFDAEETPALSPDEVAALPPDFWESARLEPVAAFRLLSFRYPVNAYLQSVWDATPHPGTRRQDSWVVVYRKNYALWRLDLTRPAHDLLQELVSGATVGDAVGKAAAPGRRPWVGEQQLFAWFRDWLAEGIFRSVKLP